MVSQSSHTNHEFLILVTRVTNVNFARESCHLPKRVDNVIYEENFPTSKILVV